MTLPIIKVAFRFFEVSDILRFYLAFIKFWQSLSKKFPHHSLHVGSKFRLIFGQNSVTRKNEDFKAVF